MKIKTDSNGFYFAVLLFLSLMTHFYAFGQPEQVVFDEVHFGKYVTSYCCTSKRIFDIHPPHGKILIAYTARLSGYKGEQDFSKISNLFPTKNNRPLRFLPALMGALLIPLMFVLMIQLNASQTAALLAALIVLFDTALLTQSRFVFLDSILLACIFSSISLAIWASQQRKRITNYVGFIIAGGLAGIAVGTKFTGLVALALPFFYAAYQIVKGKNITIAKQWLIAAMLFLFGFGVIYLLGWYIHFSQLNQPGPGDIWGILNGSFFEKLQQIHITMFKANANLTTPHHDASMWFGWPFMHNPIYYWNGLGRKIYLIGNPVIWWGSILLLISCVLTLGLMKASNLQIMTYQPEQKEAKNKKKQKNVAELCQVAPMLWFPLMGYFIAFLPLVLVSRPLFLYHYFTPLLLSIMVIIMWLDKIGWIKPSNLFQQRASFYFVLALIFTGFILMSPLSYGLSQSVAISDFIFSVIPKWR